TGGPAVTKPIVTSFNGGVPAGSPVVRSARYCRYVELADTVAPDAARARKVVQSLAGSFGFGVLPVRTESARLVPVGVAAVHDTLPQATGPPALKIRDKKLPEAAYGVMRSQSTDTEAPPTENSLMIGRIVAAIATVWIATSWPSIENATLDAFQSMRYR